MRSEFSHPSVEQDADITGLLDLVQKGDPQAIEQLALKTYGALKGIARARLALAQRDVLLDTTALVNECFLRFSKAQKVQLADREHYFRYAAAVMRSVIVDLARAKNAERRGRGAPHASLSEGVEPESKASRDILRVHEALQALWKFDVRMAQVVELRYFVGLTEAEIAEVLGLCERTVRRDWVKAKLFLAEALQ